MARKKNEIDEVNADVAASVDFDNLDDIVPIDDSPVSNVSAEETSTVPVLVKKPLPAMTDPDWTSRILEEFEPNELEEGLPKVDGLRRAVRRFLGPILRGRAKVKQVPTIENEQRATVEYTVVVLNKFQLEDDEEPYVIEFTDVADAYRGNIKGLEYARFPTAMASTRAEVRALRKALNLSVVGSDETSDQPLEEAGFTGKITESQITKIDIKCNQLGIDVIKFINMGKAKYKSIEDVSNLTAVKMFGLINEYQQYDPSGRSSGKPIPDSIQGYNPNWRGDF